MRLHGGLRWPWMELDLLCSHGRGRNRDMSLAQDQKRFSSSADGFQKPRFFLMEQGRVTGVTGGLHHVASVDRFESDSFERRAFNP